MGVVSGNFVSGTIIGAIQTTSDTRLISSVPLEEWRYEPGIIVIDQLGTFPVTDNTSDEIVSDSQISPENALGKSFVLYDDDDYNRTNPVTYGDNNEDVDRTETTFSRVQTSGDPEKNVFAPVYILPKYDGGGDFENNDDGLTFVLNLEEEDFVDQIDLGRDSGNAESDSFWVAYIQLAYQPKTSNDRDPDTDRGILPDETDLGVTPDVLAIDVIPTDCSGVPRGAHGSLLFLEAIRDVYDLEDLKESGLTVPHEIAHQFGILGDQSGQNIMSSELNPESTFIAEHIHLLRCRVRSPGH